MIKFLIQSENEEPGEDYYTEITFDENEMVICCDGEYLFDNLLTFDLSTFPKIAAKDVKVDDYLILHNEPYFVTKIVHM